MKKWNLIVDVAKCTNCNCCTLANQDEHVGNEFPGYSAPMPKHGSRWIDIRTRERGSGPVMDVAYLPVLCQHCDDAPCIKAATNGAVTKRADGIVHIDPVKAKGQKAIADACPYGAVRWNEELALPQHWFFDAHLLDRGWKEPRCAQVCATGAMKAVKVTDEEMAAIKAQEGLSELQPEAATKPRVHYKNLDRYTHEFIGGTVIKTVNGVTDCVADAKIRLESSGAVVGEAVSDAYGEFKIEGLKPDSGRYRVVIEVGGREAKRLDVELRKSVYVGRIELGS
ncbi:MAG TPA: 4Fe-4S dicluster domain-containing protein [Gammaproteobacteria bacterium]